MQLTKAQATRQRYIMKCISKEMTTAEAAFELGLSQRAIQQNIKAYRSKGVTAFIHGNLKKCHRSHDNELRRNRIINVFKNTRIDGINPFEKVTYMYFTDILNDEFNIKASVSWVKSILNSLGYKTPVNYRSKKKQDVHLFRERKEHFGELVQADGTPFDWFGTGKRYCIQGYIDDATGIPLGLHMTKNECLFGYVEAFRKMSFRYGIPEQLYPDKASVFFVSQKTTDEEKHLTQFGRMMEELGVDMFPAHSPQAKGRIERFWGTIQKQLPVQFKLHGIKTIDDANEFMANVYIPRFIKKYAKKAKGKESKFIKADMKKINSVLRAKFPARTDRGGIFTFKGYKFFTPDLPNSKIVIKMNEYEGIWISPEKSEKRYEIKLVETDTSGKEMPEVMKELVEKVFLQNTKPKFREVYFDIDMTQFLKYGNSKKKA